MIPENRKLESGVIVGNSKSFSSFQSGNWYITLSYVKDGKSLSNGPFSGKFVTAVLTGSWAYRPHETYYIF